MNRWIYFLYGLWSLCLPFIGWATPINTTQSSGYSPTHTLRVGVFLEDPTSAFARQNKNGTYDGLAIRMWQMIAETNGWSYQYIPVPINSPIGANAHGTTFMAQQIAANHLDLIVGPISIIASSLDSVDYTKPYFAETIAIAVHKKFFSFLLLLKIFLHPLVQSAVLAFLLSFLIYVHVLWLLERGKWHNLPRDYSRGITTIIWLHSFRKSFIRPPTTLLGRIIGIVWVVLALLLLGSVIATITSTASKAITAVRNPGTIMPMDQVIPLKVAMLPYMSVMLNDARQLTLNRVIVPDLTTAMNLMIEKKVEGVIDENVSLQTYIDKHHLHNIILSRLPVGDDAFAFALPYGSPLRKPVNITLSKLQASGSFIPICKEYVGTDYAACIF